MQNPYTAINAAVGAIDAKLRPGQSFNLRGITLPHYPIADTALAACLRLLGIPFRDPEPFTHDVGLDANANETGQTKFWWLGKSSTADCVPIYHTEKILGAWEKRAEFELAEPQHPLIPMRRALESRAWWISVIHRQVEIAGEVRGASALAYRTESLRSASVLRALGYEALAFNGRTFFLAAARGNTPAHLALERAESLEMMRPEQWMRRVLHLHDEMLRIAKSQSVLLRQVIEDQTLILTADSLPKTRDQFHRLL